MLALGLAFVAWSLGLLALGLRTTFRLPWQGVAGTLALATVLVGGQTAFFTDFLNVADRSQGPVFAFVLGLTFLLLTVVFRSIVLPIKAILMNLLSVGAAYGAVTLVFQEGVGIGFFNAIGFQFHRTDAIEAWLPLFLFSILFGLSMDYHVFILSRVKELVDRGHSTEEAVSRGIRSTAGTVTSAAIVMVAVFGDKGRHARSTVGVSALPADAAVEVEGVFEGA